LSPGDEQVGESGEHVLMLELARHDEREAVHNGARLYKVRFLVRV